MLKLLIIIKAGDNYPGPENPHAENAKDAKDAKDTELIVHKLSN